MKRPVFGIVLVLLIAFVAGCVNSARQPYAAANRSRPRAFALAVTVNGGLQPTPLQWAAIQAKFADEFAWRGWVLVTDLALADYIVRVDFTPDPKDPENNGHAVVLGIRDNPRALLGTLTTLSPYPTSFSYMGSFRNALWSPSFSNSYYGYYGWGDSYYDGFSYSSPTLNPVKPPVVTTPPYRHHFHPPEPGQPYCPPVDPTHPHRHYLPGDFAPTPPAQPTYVADVNSFNRPRWNSDSAARSWSGNSSRSDSGSSNSDRSAYSRRDSSWSNSNSSADRAYARADWGQSSSDHGYSRSGSSWNSDHYSRSDSSYSRSDSSYSRSESSSPWHSRSEPSSSSYSSSSYSSGSSFSSSSPSSSSSDSSSSSSSSSSPSYSSGSSSSDSSSGGGSSSVGGRAQQN